MKRQQITKTNQGDYLRKTLPAVKPAFPTRAPASPLVQLQRNLGNEAYGHFYQAKLEVNQPGDAYEQEADRIAEQVMRMPEPVSIIQAKEVAGGTPAVSPAVESHINGIQGRGQPLPEPVLAFFEPRFRHDFSQVRMHTDSQAAESARTVNALAYTVGQDVVFGAGRYEPGTSAGKKLLAHELTHTIQQARESHRPILHHQPLNLEQSARISQDDQTQALPISPTKIFAPFLQRLVPDSGASTSAPADGINSFAMSPGMIADETSTAGNPAGHNEGVEFALRLAPNANPADFAVVQLVRGSMTFRDASGNLGFINVNLHGATVPFQFQNWVVDSINTNPEYGTTHSPAVAISSQSADWGDEPGISPGTLGAELPVPTRFKVWFRTGIYRRPIPSTVAAFQSARPTPLAEIRWAIHWRNQGSPPQIVDKPISPM